MWQNQTVVTNGLKAVTASQPGRHATVADVAGAGTRSAGASTVATQ